MEQKTKKIKNEISVVIPNYNGRQYLTPCIEALKKQDCSCFEIIIVDNGSDDGSEQLVSESFPEVRWIGLDDNYGFCTAVNTGIRASESEYIILLNNDTEVFPDFVSAMLAGIRKSPNAFSGAAKMLQLHAPEKIDDAGDFYCCLGWAFARGKGKAAEKYQKESRVFAACGGASIYRRAVFDEIGYFDERHFAYLEDIDIGYRAKIHGYINVYLPQAKVHHVGSGTSGSRYNEFKMRYASRNNIYMIYKNMPWLQILLNLPFLLVGFAVKLLFFAVKGMGREYAAGIKNGISLSADGEKVKFCWKNTHNYVKIQFELWLNVILRLFGG